MPRSTRTALVVLIAALIFSGACSTDQSPGPTPPPRPDLVAVPDVVDLSLEKASARLCAAGLSAGRLTVDRTVDQSTSGVVEAIVKATNPRAGEEIAVGTPVSLRVSVRGPGSAALRLAC